MPVQGQNERHPRGKRKAGELAALRAVAAACVEAADEHALIERVTDIICGTLSITNFGVILYDLKTGLLRDHPSAHRRRGSTALELVLGEGIVGTVALSGLPRRVPDVSLDPIYRMGDQDTRSELTVPLKVGDQIIGVINSESTELNAFTEEDEHLLMVLAGQVGPTIARLRTIQTLRDSEEKYRALYEDNPSMVLTLDARGTILSVNRFGARQLGYCAEELVGRSLLSILHQEARADALSLLAGRLAKPGEVAQWERRHVRSDGGELMLKASGRAIRGTDGEPVVLVVCEDITERKLAEERSEESLRQLEKLLDETVQTLAAVVEVKDPYTSGHQRRVVQLATAIAGRMDLPPSQVQTLRVAGLLHDIGKIQVPSDILSKPGSLSDAERTIIQTHSEVGHRLLRGISFEGPAAEIVLQHHERMDGSGYPNHLKGSDILLEARILGVADVVEAISSHRPYRPALGIGHALSEVSTLSGVLYDPAVVDACLGVFATGGFAFD